ncbi:two-component system, sensor histidine kinase YesM [Paenibacillus catalpae]|uniref:Two-component system, sensor histidine kinase YesM n=1 Tax=Paenibacillus catalpae TaxID=1045775 RepID=A0A1I1VP09_9BACL|nr:sensor histidine kinase [Paenibacillus catalpae]SFD84832.1 two-component system, sensor histidine kinase YesM [Paenibacillus catalpae]
MRVPLSRWMIRFTRGMSLRGKILALYVLILLLPTLLLGSGAVYLVVRGFHNSYLSAVDESARQTAQIADFSKRNYDLLAVRTATDGELAARLSRQYDDMAKVVDTVNYIDRTFLITGKYLPGIIDFRIYHTNDTLVQDGQLLWRPESRIIAGQEESIWYRNTMAAAEPLKWSSVPGNPDRVVITHKIMDTTGNPLGLVYILLNYDAVFGELVNHPFNDRGSLFIVDHDRSILASTDRKQIGKKLALNEWQEDFAEEPAANTADWLDLTHSKELLIVKPLSSGWNVVSFTAMKQLSVEDRKTLLLIVGITIFFLLLSISLMMTVVQNIVRRLRKLGNRMGDLSRGEFEAAIRYSERDELGELENMFNLMSERLGKLVEDITHAGLQEKEQAFKALQAQINPHFIYNSLGLLRWRAMIARDQEQIQIIDSLTTFYRLTLNNQISVIRIREEVEHAKAYLDICQFRYPGKVRVEWDIDDSVLDLYTIKTVLQPIVENCYQHGAIVRRPDAFIRISMARLDDRVMMSVYDNGQGIPEVTITQLAEGRYAGKGNGCGSANIKERLALYFGTDACYTLESALGAWTLVTIDFPACQVQPAIRKGR